MITYHQYQKIQPSFFITSFNPKPKIDLENIDITQETKQKLIDLQQKYEDIISKHSSDTGPTNLEEMKIDTDPNLPPLGSKPYPYP